MPLVARKDGAEVVNTVHVSVGDANPLDGIACDAAPQNIATEQGSDDVFVEGIGVVRKGDNEQAHTIPGCSTHQTGLATHSNNVFANDKEIGRKDDTYGCGAQITSVTQSTVFANGQ
tara:strand:+ start:2085 stop:2435 length:351 start_codon:yes stop_codon:yes gene_type:complete